MTVYNTDAPNQMATVSRIILSLIWTSIWMPVAIMMSVAIECLRLEIKYTISLSWQKRVNRVEGCLRVGRYSGPFRGLPGGARIA
ncbi:hypothetical protein EVAR_28851_1 [Eumeta japonica]|uniref:Uncharacterized protein n=1 Tax=Eumeta variegata TaxID=151549 RepID=A0A4C1YM06_EUMVA|nr:hypothetical protein EVAR_28851_1 [Eumeta japonica]